MAIFRSSRFASLLPMALLLAACAGDGAPPDSDGSLPPPSPPRAAQRHPLVPAAHVLSGPGFEGVIGATAAELIRRFGEPRLDVWEGDARKLQFAGVPCILDIYLYPPSTGAPPRATFLDARRSDGRDVDRAACVSALRQH